MKYRCKSPHDMKYEIMSIDDDDVELMFGIVGLKGSPFFIELYLKKVLNHEFSQMVESSRVAETSVSRMEVTEIVESGASTEKSSYMVCVDRHGNSIEKKKIDDCISFSLLLMAQR